MDISLVNDYLYMFACCKNLREICISDAGLYAKINELFTNYKNSQDMQYVFYDCKNLTNIISYK